MTGPRQRGAGLVVALTLGLFLAAASAPTPLYAVWASSFGFSAPTLTAVFAVYAASLLLALLTTGALSDARGRRPVVLGALAGLAGAALLFALADGVAPLYAGRLLQGFATGVATSALSAWLLDVQARPGRGALLAAAVPTAGLALGAVGAGALVQYGPSPFRLVWVVLLAGCLAMAGLVARLPDPVAVRRAPDLRPRLAVPRALRPAFGAAVPCLVATWALGGLFLSLGPTLVLDLAGSTDRLLGASAVGVLAGSGALAVVALQAWPPDRAATGGSAALLAGVLAAGGAVVAGTAVGLLLACAVAGTGFGLAFSGVVRSLAGRADASSRSALLSAVYLVSYTAFSVPALLAGLAAPRAGLRDTAVGYSLAVAALAAASVVLTRRQVLAPDGKAVS